jgi:hypothetical protein
LNDYNDKRIVLKRNGKNLGLFPTLNSLCKEAKGDLIKLWAQDDIMNPSCLQEVVNFHEKYPEVGFSYSDREIIDEQNNAIITKTNDRTPEIIPPFLHDEIAFFTGSIAGNIANVTIVKRHLKIVGWFNESMKISADFDMWVKLSAKNPVGRIPKPLVKLRDHQGQLSRSSKYYILHLKEDKQVFANLINRTPPDKKNKAMWVLKHTKHLFYFSLMLHMFLKRDLRTAKAFYNEISKIDNVISLCIRWVRKRIFKQDILKGYYPLQHLENLKTKIN